MRRALLTWGAGEGVKGRVEKEVSIEKCVGTVLPHLRGKGARMRLKNGLPGVEEGTPGGSNFDPRPPGASWAAGQAQEGALGGKGSLLFFLKRPKKVFFEDPFCY